MERVVEFTLKAKADIDFFKKTGNTQILKKIRALLEAILENPYEGIGKPEQLKHELTGFWSRRISREHRMIYQVDEEKITIHSTKGHY